MTFSVILFGVWMLVEIYELFQKYIHNVKFYPSANFFLSQMLLMMLVTNIISDNFIAPFVEIRICSVWYSESMFLKLSKSVK